jgi:NADPH2:quinone reductase
MRAVYCRDWRPFDDLEIADLPDPAPPPRGLRIRVMASGVSFATSLVVQGKYQRKPPRPFTPGTEIAGIVDAVGEGATRFKVGDRVFSVVDWGGLAEMATTLEVNTYPMPDSASFAEAISFTNSYGTSAAALMWPHLLQLEAGESLLVHGAAGGVGIAAVEIGKILGATVIATAGSAEKLDVVRQHGANHMINYREDSFRDAVMDITNGKGVDVVYDPVGGDVFAQSLRCMAVEGRIMPVGFAGGDIQSIPANLLLVKNIAVTGLNFGYYVGWSPHDARYESEPRLRPMMEQIGRWYEDGAIKPEVAGVFALDQFRDAMAMVLGRQAIGRVAIVHGEEAAYLGVTS